MWGIAWQYVTALRGNTPLSLRVMIVLLVISSTSARRAEVVQLERAKIPPTRSRVAPDSALARAPIQEHIKTFFNSNCTHLPVDKSGFTPTTVMADKIEAAMEKVKETIDANAPKVTAAAEKYGGEARQAGESLFLFH